MAEEQNETEAQIEATLDQNMDVPTKSKKRRRNKTYKVLGSSKIPVSKSYGKLWKARIDNSLAFYTDVIEAWEEAVRYFQNDQLGHRTPEEHASGNRLGNRRLNENITETENVVFANVSTMVPTLYSRNPTAEITATNEANKDFARIVETLVNTLAFQFSAPGINLKPKAKRCVVTTLLTNRSWLQIGWIFKDNSRDEALADLEQLAKQLAKAKTDKQVEEIEGRIQALEAAVDVLARPGPECKFKNPKEVIIDPSANEVDLSDAKWIAVQEMIPTAFLQARYGKKKRGSTEYRSIYQPTHVLRAGEETDTGHEDDNFVLFKQGDDAKSFGFNDSQAFERSKMTKVWLIWDRTTLRLFMYNEKDWTWPIWVWDDPLQLDSFFPLYPLTMYESPSGPLTKGEVTYYLDQQDAINEMNDEERRARRWARRNVVFDKNRVTLHDVEAVLKGDDGTARGVDVPEGMKMDDVITTIIPPSIKHQELFNKEDKYRAIDRISSVSETLRGAQFKTNTNKAAVQANVTAANVRVDEKTDAIEDWIGRVLWGIAQLCIINMPKEEVVSIIGPMGEEWRNMSAAEIAANFSLRVVGGTTKKPTSQAKKEEALELGQVLGQFVNAAPGPVLKVMLKMMEQAFDEITIKEEDWEEIAASLDQQQAAQTARPQSGNGQASPEAAQQAQAQGDQFAQLMSMLPPQIQQAIESAISQGVPPQQAIQSVMQQLSQTVQ